MRGIRSKKIFYRPSCSWYNPVICCYKWKFFWSILFLNKSQRSHLFVLHIIKKTFSTGQKPVLTVKIMISEQVNLASAFFYFGQVFVFCRFINKNVLETDKSSQQRCSVKRAILGNFAVFTGKHLCWSLFFIKLQTFNPWTLLKKELTQVFSFSCSCSETSILKNICVRQLLNWLYEVIVWNFVFGQSL